MKFDSVQQKTKNEPKWILRLAPQLRKSQQTQNHKIKKKGAFSDNGEHELKSNFWSEACAGRPALLFLAAARPVALLGEQLHHHQ
jgi:hypothetical protein